MTTRRTLTLLVAGLLLAACDPGSGGAASTTTTSVVATTAATTTVPTTIAPTTVATTVAPTTVPAPGELFFVDGALLGISQGTLLSDAEAILGVAAVPLATITFHPGLDACTNTPDPVAIRTGGWTLVFETDGGGSTWMTNWIYVGGPAAGYTGIVAPGGVRIGDPRSAVEVANPGFADLGFEIEVYEPFPIFYDVESGNVDWFGLIDCILEGD
jgi:hypothetical protein